MVGTFVLPLEANLPSALVLSGVGAAELVENRWAFAAAAEQWPRVYTESGRTSEIHSHVCCLAESIGHSLKLHTCFEKFRGKLQALGVPNSPRVHRQGGASALGSAHAVPTKDTPVDGQSGAHHTGGTRPGP